MTNDADWLSPQWMQAALDALKATVDENTNLKNQMIEFLVASGLWAEESKWDTAVNRFNACLNPARPQCFKLIELWALMRRFERFELFHAMAADLGFEVRRLPTEERRLAALERIAAALEANNALAAESRAELARLDSAGASLRVHAMLRDGTGSFDNPHPDETVAALLKGGF